MAQSVGLIWGIVTLTFLLLHLAPGDPADRFLRPEIDPKTVAILRHNFGLDEPLLAQYGKWLARLAHGDLGHSLATGQPVIEILREALPATFQLTALALCLDLFLGSLLGAVAALRKYSLADQVISHGGLVLYSLPTFWLALMLVLLFSLKLGWLPSSHMTSVGAETWPLWAKVADRLRHLILPVGVLGLTGAASTSRYMRATFNEVLQQDFIRVARAKGLNEERILFKHALRNALLPLVTLFGLSFPFLLGGAFVVESIFAWPGMGRVSLEAAFARDYPVVLATNLVAAVMVVLGNLVADLLYGVVDPRLRNT